MQNDISSLKSHLTNNEHITVSSDGSLKHRSMSTAVRITYHSVLLYAASHIVPGDTLDSFRPELAGVVSILRLLDSIPSLGQVKVTQHLDNQSVIRFCTNNDFPPTPRNLDKTSADIRLEFVHLAAKLPITLEFQHIDGHQDDQVPFHKLPTLAKENVLYDLAAKRTHAFNT